MMQPDPDQFARETLRLLGPDPANWVPDRDGIDHNVLVIGGGHSGTALAYALRRAGIGKVSVIDGAADEQSSGIWRSVARMHKLRTPKSLVGPELGNVGLSFQAWYEARHGEAAYAALDTVPRLDWADYISWFRKLVAVEIRYRTRLERIEPADGHFKVHLSEDGARRIETARKIILANGVGGSGGPFVPEVLRGLSAEHLAHTADAIDFDALKGRSVAVVGAAASAFDAAAVALEHGAKAVHLFSRRPELAATAVNKVRGYAGMYDNYHALPDAVRWHQAVRYRRSGTTAPKDTVQRATRHPNFHIHLGSPWPQPRVLDEQVQVDIGGETLRFDFVIAGTGYFVDLSTRAELRDVAHHALLWRDRYAPPPHEQDEALGLHPYLGQALQLQERQPGTAPYLRDIHIYNVGGFVSAGLPVGDVPCIRRDLPAVVAGISRDLLLADLDVHERRITAPVEPDFDRSFYAASVSTPGRAAAA